MTKIVWSEPASRDFVQLIAFVREQHSPNIAMRRIMQISEAVERLIVWPHYGHPIHRHRHLRRLYVRLAKCHVYYRLHARQEIHIVRLESELQRPGFQNGDRPT
jgi:plasmid stabilization system protein ParE